MLRTTANSKTIFCLSSSVANLNFKCVAIPSGEEFCVVNRAEFNKTRYSWCPVRVSNMVPTEDRPKISC